MSELKTHIEIEEQYYFSDNDYDSCHEIICRELEAHEQAEYPEVDEKGVIAYTNDPAHAELICRALNAKSDIVAISRKCAIEAADYTRLMILAIKHCPKEHQDWADVLRLTEHLETRIAASRGAE